ncbi:MAG: sulfite exporter TauE/SafE family protein [Clostridia bacterium]|nr:sulfite exporter TauE/SafE family protein [Clostridia bacterium]
MLKKIVIGFIAGLINGFFATGGGMILVPAFVYGLKMDEKDARSTSIFCILPMVIVSSIFYFKSNYIDWNISIMCAIGGIIGGYIGAKILKKIPEKILQITFIAFLLYISYQMIFN